MVNDLSNTTPITTPAADLSTLLIGLLKGVLYRDADERLWGVLLGLQARVRDYVTILNLDLVLDEAEGYAFLKGRPEPKDEGQASSLPRLVARRQLSFPVSLLLALLRKKLAEFDTRGGDTRLVMSRDEIIELIRVFMPPATNEAKFTDQFETHINKVVELGFLRKLKPAEGSASAGGASYEVRRILRALVDAQWLGELDARLEGYRAQFADSSLVEDEREHG
jgi:Domain of unknown function (DUF4194)